ncbi:MAG: phytanoyl-CoA dioxygenase family protein [Planctomycetes bacterium]|nr:phytanoyl-CoA dioxygenase family protein [Planctomycetota bacterium]
MPELTEEQAVKKRQELVELGYCVVPGVLRGSLLERMRQFTNQLFERKAVDPRYRYQGSDFHIASKRLWEKRKSGEYSELVDELVDLPEAWEACRRIGLEHQRPDDTIIVLSKPAYGPPLYWHQDLMNWNHPESASPWPTRVFLSYYMTDTTLENGCLRAIPGTHRKRIPLHDHLPPAHGPEIQAIRDLSHPAFQDHPDAVDLPVRGGDLVINDARLLHGARANRTPQRRTLVLQWHSIFEFPKPPSWWDGEIPDAVRNHDPDVKYERSRTPSMYLR